VRDPCYNPRLASACRPCIQPLPVQVTDGRCFVCAARLYIPLRGCCSYVASFQTVANAGSIIAGFAFEGFMLDRSSSKGYTRQFFFGACAVTFCSGLLTLVYATCVYAT